MTILKRTVAGSSLTLIVLLAGGSIQKNYANAASTRSALFQQSSSAQKNMDGIWVGILEVQGLKLRLILKVTQDATGVLSAKLDVPDQGASNLAALKSFVC